MTLPKFTTESLRESDQTLPADQQKQLIDNIDRFRTIITTEEPISDASMQSAWSTYQEIVNSQKQTPLNRVTQIHVAQAVNGFLGEYYDPAQLTLGHLAFKLDAISTGGPGYLLSGLVEPELSRAVQFCKSMLEVPNNS